jgi:hypothetical protein
MSAVNPNLEQVTAYLFTFLGRLFPSQLDRALAFDVLCTHL